MEPSPTFDPRALPRSFYDNKIRELAAEHKRLVAAAAEVSEDIKWWTAGRDRFATEGDHTDQAVLDGMPADAPADGVAPENLRAAITFVMRPGRRMRPAEVIEALRDHGWMPTAKTGPQMIRNRMLDMHGRDELDRDDEGVYWLPMLTEEP
jgi:hypothetical protein